MTFKNQWITEKIDKETVKWAENFAKNDLLKMKKTGKGIWVEGSLSTSQIRKFFGEVKRIQALGYENAEMDVVMLKPKLAYAAGRQNQGHPIHKFYQQFGKMLDIIATQDHFDNFVRILEAVVAYHKAEGGK